MTSAEVYIDLPTGLDATDWARRYSRGEVPDLAPWGLQHLREFNVAPVMRAPVLIRSPDKHGVAAVAARVAASARHRSSGLELMELTRDALNKQRRHADVIFCYDERTGVPAALLPRRLGPPTVTGIGWLTTRAAGAALQSRLALRALPRAAAVFTQCRPILDLLHDEWSVPRQRAHFVPFGIDTDFYTEKPWSDDGAPPLVVSAGEDRFRDHDLLVAAVAALGERFPGLHLELATSMTVSAPPDLVTQHTERLGGRMRELYARSSVVAVALKPTPTGSGLSVILEAMASGRPVVATRNPGIDDYVRDGIDGVLVAPGDVDAFAAALAGLLADPARAQDMGKQASQRVRDHFTSRVMASHFAELIHTAAR